MRLALLGAASALILLAAAASAAASCRADQVEISGDFGTVRFRVEVADTPASRAQGLMFVRHMPRMAGMLFVYERPETVSFWMENTYIPLDMIFADATGTVQRIHTDAVPLDRTPIPGGEAIQYVLEINAGLSESLGLSEGDILRHPAIAQDRAAWPCAAP